MINSEVEHWISALGKCDELLGDDRRCCLPKGHDGKHTWWSSKMKEGEMDKEGPCRQTAQEFLEYKIQDLENELRGLKTINEAMSRFKPDFAKDKEEASWLLLKLLESHYNHPV